MNKVKVGTQVLIKKLLVRISPEKGWEYVKNVPGVVVENADVKPYYHTCSGDRKDIQKHFGERLPTDVVVSSDIKDISNNNVIVFHNYELRFPPQRGELRSSRSFRNGDKVKYAYGLTFVFIGVDPFDKNYAYCIHPTAICLTQPELKEKRVDRLPIDRLTITKDV